MKSKFRFLFHHMKQNIILEDWREDLQEREHDRWHELHHCFQEYLPLQHSPHLP